MTTESDDRLWLPHLLYEIRERFGQAVALRFAADFGGRRLPLPETPTPDHAVAKAFGPDLLAWLIEQYPGGAAIPVPLGPESSYNKRIATIRRLLRAGEDDATIIRIVRCTERTLYRHRRALRLLPPSTAQGSFDLR